MDKKSLYTEAYRILEKCTPLKTDCGVLCDKACCQGDEDTGMYLFPGEEIMYEPLPDFMKIKSTDFEYTEEKCAGLAVCTGECDRTLRPLACRIFPLTPYLTSNGILMIKIDPRARYICPLARYGKRKTLNQDFISAVRKTFQMLMQDEEIKAFLEALSRMLDSFEKEWSI